MNLRLRTAIVPLAAALILPMAGAAAITVTATPASAAENSDYLAFAYSPSVGDAYIGRSPDKDQTFATGSLHENAVVSNQSSRLSPWRDGYRDGRNDAAANALEVAKAHCSGKDDAPGNPGWHRDRNSDQQYAAGYEAGWKAGWKPAYDRSVRALCPRQ
jgi:hypothetical protein